MRRVLEEHEPYPYLMRHARARLRDARHVAKNSQLTTSPLVCLGENDKEQTMWCLLPWLGSYAFLALERLLKIKCAGELGIKGLSSSRPYFMTFVMREDEQAFFSVVKEAAEALEDPMELLYPAEIPTSRSTTSSCPQSSSARALPAACSTWRECGRAWRSGS